MRKAFKNHNWAIAQKTVSKFCVGVDYSIINMLDFFQIFVNFERTAVDMDWKIVRYLMHANIRVFIDWAMVR